MYESHEFFFLSESKDESYVTLWGHGLIYTCFKQTFSPFDASGRVITTGILQSLPQETTGRRLQKTVWLLTKLLVILQWQTFSLHTPFAWVWLLTSLYSTMKSSTLPTVHAGLFSLCFGGFSNFLTWSATDIYCFVNFYLLYYICMNMVSVHYNKLFISVWLLFRSWWFLMQCIPVHLYAET